jgi:hypothetical protein
MASATRTEATVRLSMTPNDEIERCGVAPTPNEADLPQSSTPSLAHRSYDPRESLEPIVRRRAKFLAVAILFRDSLSAILAIKADLIYTIFGTIDFAPRQ